MGMHLVHSALQEVAMHWGIFRPFRRQSYAGYLDKSLKLYEKSKNFALDSALSEEMRIRFIDAHLEKKILQVFY